MILQFQGIEINKLDMFKLPDDILNKIDHDFDFEDVQDIKDLLTELYAHMHRDGPIIQAIRGMIFLANGDAWKIRTICVPYLQREPRDIIVEAEEKAGNPGHWFNIPFDEMEKLNNYFPEIEPRQSDDAGLPF